MPLGVLGRPIAGRRLFLSGLAVTLAIFAGAMGRPSSTAHASDPYGIYALVEQVTLEPEDGVPTHVRIHGVFGLSVRPKEGSEKNHGIYLPAKDGYLYFQCPPGKSEICRMEWADLQKAIGSGKCAAFGDRYLTDPFPNGTLHPYTDIDATPDAYPIANGVQLVLRGSSISDGGDTCTVLKDYRRDHAPPPGAPVGPALPTDTAEPGATEATPPAIATSAPVEPTKALQAPNPKPNPAANRSFMPKADMQGGQSGTSADSSGQPADGSASSTADAQASGGPGESGGSSGMTTRWSLLAVLLLAGASGLVWWRRRTQP